MIAEAISRASEKQFLSGQWADMDHGAVFSGDRTLRVALWRRWGNTEIKANGWVLPDKGGWVLFVGLNPSIADETRLDPTVTRCMNYAKRWGFGGLLMGNLYAKVSTDPKGVNFNSLNENYYSDNDLALIEMNLLAAKTIVAWGTHANYFVARESLKMLSHDRDLYCLGTNKNGSPKHPLYLRADAEPKLLVARGSMEPYKP